MSKARDLADLAKNANDRLDTVATSDGALSNRNILINGKFEVNQHNDGSSTSVSSGAAFVADRFDYYTNAGAAAVYSATHEISTDAPDGFEKSLKVTCTSGGSIPATGEAVFRQNIEGYNISQLNYGLSEAKDATVSFWIKASVTGDYGLQFVYYDGSDNQFYVSKYTVNTANTWEYKTVTIPPQTSNGFDNTTNGVGLHLYWDWGEGSTYSGTANTGWTTTYKNGLTGGVKLMENTNATWQITGVQLEVGDTATPFEHRSYGDELARCQRYFQRLRTTTSEAHYLSVNTQYAWIKLQSPVPLRVYPSASCPDFRTRYLSTDDSAGAGVQRTVGSITPQGGYASTDAKDFIMSTCYIYCQGANFSRTSGGYAWGDFSLDAEL